MTAHSNFQALHFPKGCGLEVAGEAQFTFNDIKWGHNVKLSTELSLYLSLEAKVIGSLSILLDTTTTQEHIR